MNTISLLSIEINSIIDHKNNAFVVSDYERKDKFQMKCIRLNFLMLKIIYLTIWTSDIWSVIWYAHEARDFRKNSCSTAERDGLNVVLTFSENYGLKSVLPDCCNCQDYHFVALFYYICVMAKTFDNKDRISNMTDVESLQLPIDVNEFFFDISCLPTRVTLSFFLVQIRIYIK